MSDFVTLNTLIIMFREIQKISFCEGEPYVIREKKQLRVDSGVVTTINSRLSSKEDKRPIFNQYSLTDMLKAGIDVKQVPTKVLSKNLDNDTVF